MVPELSTPPVALLKNGIQPSTELSADCTAGEVRAERRRRPRARRRSRARRRAGRPGTPRAGQPARGVLGEEQRDAHAERHGDEHRDHRRDDRRPQQVGDAEPQVVAGDVPLGGGQEVGAGRGLSDGIGLGRAGTTAIRVTIAITSRPAPVAAPPKSRSPSRPVEARSPPSGLVAAQGSGTCGRRRRRRSRWTCQISSIRQEQGVDGGGRPWWPPRRAAARSRWSRGPSAAPARRSASGRP